MTAPSEHAGPVAQTVGQAAGTSIEDSRAVTGLTKLPIAQENELMFRWRRPQDTVGLAGYEYQIHARSRPAPDTWERAGSVPDGEFRPCRTKPDWLILGRGQTALCTHALDGWRSDTYEPLTWVKLYTFRVRAVYEDGTRGSGRSEISERAPPEASASPASGHDHGHHAVPGASPPGGSPPGGAVVLVAVV